MLARRRMIGRPVARVATAAVGTAVVAGTAGAVHHHQQQKWAQQDAAAQAQYDQAYQQGAADAQAQQYAAPPAQYAAPPVQYAAPPVQYAAPVEQAPAPDMMAQLQQLAQLHDSGALTDEEFAAAKQKLLG
jgi:hypothetical protein